MKRLRRGRVLVVVLGLSVLIWVWGYLLLLAVPEQWAAIVAVMSVLAILGGIAAGQVSADWCTRPRADQDRP